MLSKDYISNYFLTHLKTFPGVISVVPSVNVILCAKKPVSVLAKLTQSFAFNKSSRININLKVFILSIFCQEHNFTIISLLAYFGYSLS